MVVVAVGVMTADGMTDGVDSPTVIVFDSAIDVVVVRFGVTCGSIAGESSIVMDEHFEVSSVDGNRHQLFPSHWQKCIQTRIIR